MRHWTQKNIAAERAELMEKQSKLASTISDLNIREIQLELNEQRIREKRSKVERQLDAIDHIINDPEYLERIEPDNDLFTQGNWNLLRKTDQFPQVITKKYESIRDRARFQSPQPPRTTEHIAPRCTSTPSA
jgi:uncharacterized protein (DUF3084 family)